MGKWSLTLRYPHKFEHVIVSTASTLKFIQLVVPDSRRAVSFAEQRYLIKRGVIIRPAWSRALRVR
jgi:hypothetical protein